MSAVVDQLKSARHCAWASLRPAFDHAIGLAHEAEYEAKRAANVAMTHVAPAYPPLVLRLAEAAPKETPDA